MKRECCPDTDTHGPNCAWVAREKEVQQLRAAFEEMRPQCDSCGEPAVVKADSQGEGYYWLCGSAAQDHDEDHYCGVEIYRLPKELT